jgi:hypothetical protein
LSSARAQSSADAVFAHADDEALPVRQAVALTLNALGDARAEKLLERLGRDPTSSHLLQPHVIRALSFARHNDLVNARNELTTVVMLAPYFAEALVELARIATRQGDADAARVFVEEARYFGARIPPQQPRPEAEPVFRP